MFRIWAVAVACLMVFAAGAPAAHAKQGNPLETTGPMSVLGPMDVVRMVSQSKGKVVLFSFWASWCAPCRAEIPELNELRKSFPEDELLLAGLSVDEDPLAYSKFVSKTEIEFPVRRVTDSVSQLFRIGVIPRLVAYNTRGEMVVSHEGPVGAQDLKVLVAKLLAEK